MAEQIKVSVLITTYELEGVIEQALKSVLGQECSFGYELIVGDDGSEDDTVGIVKRYADQYPGKIRIFTMPRQAGVKYNPVHRAAANRLNILKEARGEYCCFLDGDDHYTDKERLQKMADVLDHNSDCIMCAHNLWMVYENGEKHKLMRMTKEHKYSLEQYWKLLFLQANALMFRNIYAQHTPQGALARNFDDNNITFWLFQYGKMYYLPQCMGAYMQSEGSSWNKMSELQHAALNMTGYNVEILTAPEKRALSDIRHYNDLRVLYEARGSYGPKDLQPFYDNAKKEDLTEALKAYGLMQPDPELEKEMGQRLRRAKRGYLLAKAQRALSKLMGRY